KQLILKNQFPLTIDPGRHRLERNLSLLWEKGRNGTTQNLPRTEPASSAPATFTLPRFLRRAYVGDAQRAVWQPRFDAILAAAPRLALAAAARGIAPAALVTVAAADVIVLHNDA